MEWKREVAARPSYLHEEVINSITHGLGFLMSVVAGTYLCFVACWRGDWRIALACIVYSLALAAVYGFSTLSHAILDRSWRRFFRIMDQACIYLLITGTFTPFGVAYFLEGYWKILFALMWLLAIVGFLSKTLFAHRIFHVSIPLYVALGWLPIIGIGRFMHLVQIGTLPAEGLAWVLVGGLCYTLGTPFLYLDKRDYYFHSIWHVLVMAGSACHYYAILAFALPPT